MRAVEFRRRREFDELFRRDRRRRMKFIRDAEGVADEETPERAFDAFSSRRHSDIKITLVRELLLGPRRWQTGQSSALRSSLPHAARKPPKRICSRMWDR